MPKLKIQMKAAKGATKRKLAPRPAVAGQPGAKLKAKAELKKVIHPPQQKITFKKGYGKPFDPEAIKKRHQQFLRQQRELKAGPVRSLVGRAEQRGYQKRITGIEYKRGVKVAAKRLKQFAGHRQYEVITDKNGRPIEKKVSSSWVSMVHLVMFNNQPALAITFHDGFTALYTSSNIRDYEAMSLSASKGKYIWAALYHGQPGRGAPYISIGF